MKREQYEHLLAQRIDEAMLKHYDLRHDAIFEGRIGLDEMTDSELADLGRDCYGLVWNRDA